MRYFLATAIITVLLAAPVRAQVSTDSSAPKTPLDYMYEKEKKAQEDNERQYNAQMKRLKAQNPTATSSDPWKGVRSSGGANTKH